MIGTNRARPISRLLLGIVMRSMRRRHIRFLAVSLEDEHVEMFTAAHPVGSHRLEIAATGAWVTQHMDQTRQPPGGPGCN